MRRDARTAFTLVETLLLISILGLLISLIIPAIQRVRSAADLVRCKNNLRQIGVGMHHCQASIGQIVPSNASFVPVPNSTLCTVPQTPEGLLSWMALSLPYVEQDELYAASAKACSANPDPFVAPPHIGLTTVVPVYTCPTDGRLQFPLTDVGGLTAAYTSYIGIADVMVGKGNLIGPGLYRSSAGVFSIAKPSLSLIRDGASNTVAVGERPPPDPPLAGWWYPRLNFETRKCHGPNILISLGGVKMVNCDNCVPSSHCLGPGRLDNPCDRYHLWSLHPGGANFLFADASVRLLRYDADPIVPSLITVNGGEVVDLSEFD
jgi:prepilin-type processing-associated H-X9-DG protein